MTLEEMKQRKKQTIENILYFFLFAVIFTMFGISALLVLLYGEKFLAYFYLSFVCSLLIFIGPPLGFIIDYLVDRSEKN
jgi:hypothetical protein